MTILDQDPVAFPQYCIPYSSYTRGIKVINTSEEVVFVSMAKTFMGKNRFIIRSGEDMSFMGNNGALLVQWTPGFGDGVCIAEFDAYKYPQYPSSVHNLPSLL